LRIVSFSRVLGAAPEPGALLVDSKQVLAFTAPPAALPMPADPYAWLDLDGPFLAAARALWTRVTSDRALEASLAARGAIVPRASIRLVAPVPRPRKVICIGLNYRDHAAEAGLPIPERPLFFSKFPTSVVGPGDAIEIPPGSVQVDYEAELGVVIGRRARMVSRERALDHVLGYTNVNDVSARDFQFADGQWQRGKSPDTFCPMGEAIVSPDEVGDPHNLAIRLRVNGKTLQDSRTDQLVFGVDVLISFLSQTITLEPGDLIATGTPPGVGFARKPPIFLQAGDEVEVEIEGLGILRNGVRAPE
jgi:2-keto-4-pentenoate hydratase/2-oxohepta-3-ene-1,7-dioic acid hydratase in catechol pathway